MNELAVIFDCDGVLADTESVAEHAAMAAMAPFGLTYTESDFRAKYLGLGGVLWERAIEADHLARYGAPLPPYTYAVISAAVTAAVLAKVVAVPGAVALARDVLSPKAVASSSPGPELRGKLAQLGLTDVFGPHVHGSETVALTKPEPDLFLRAALHLGVAPERCRVIEDSANGVRAARAAGMPVVGFTGTAPDPDTHRRTLERAGADAVARSMGEVGAWLAFQGVPLATLTAKGS